jgi:hypothetical protein
MKACDKIGDFGIREGRVMAARELLALAEQLREMTLPPSRVFACPVSRGARGVENCLDPAPEPGGRFRFLQIGFRTPRTSSVEIVSVGFRRIGAA